MVGLSILIANGVLGSVLIWLGSAYVDSRKIAAFSTLISLGIFYYLSQALDLSSASLQLVEQYEWIPFLNIKFIMAVDGVSWVLLALTLLIHVIIVMGAFLLEYDDMPLYMALFMFMQSMIMGVFVAFMPYYFTCFGKGC